MHGRDRETHMMDEESHRGYGEMQRWDRETQWRMEKYTIGGTEKRTSITQTQTDRQKEVHIEVVPT